MIQVIMFVVEQSDPIKILFSVLYHYYFLAPFLLVADDAVVASNFDAAVPQLIGNCMDLKFNLLAVVLDLLGFEDLFELFWSPNIEKWLARRWKFPFFCPFFQPLLLLPC